MIFLNQENFFYGGDIISIIIFYLYYVYIFPKKKQQNPSIPFQILPYPGKIKKWHVTSLEL